MMMWLRGFLLLCLQWVTVSGDNAAIIDRLLNGAVYDKRVRPGSSSGQPTVIFLDFFLNSIGSISDVRMEYMLNIYFRQKWVDNRLRFTDHNETITLNYNLYDRLWVPDTFFKNEKSGTFHQITVPNRLLRVSPDGSVYLSERLSLTLSCQMSLQDYPLDNQTCKIDVESYGYTTRDIVLKWSDKTQPAQIPDNIQLPEFSIRKNTSFQDCTVTYVTGSFSCKRVSLFIQRQRNYYIIQTYVPMSLIVVLSWISFWIDASAVAARMSIGLITTLTITTQSSGNLNQLPKVTYTKAIDVWNIVCLCFVVCAFLEYALVNLLTRRHRAQLASLRDERAASNKVDPAPTPASGPATTGFGRALALKVTADSTDPAVKPQQVHVEELSDRAPTPAVTAFAGKASNWARVVDQLKQGRLKVKNAVNDRARVVDGLARVVFPLSFLFFNCVYWASITFGAMPK